MRERARQSGGQPICGYCGQEIPDTDEGRAHHWLDCDVPVRGSDGRLHPCGSLEHPGCKHR